MSKKEIEQLLCCFRWELSQRIATINIATMLRRKQIADKAQELARFWANRKIG